MKQNQKSNKQKARQLQEFVISNRIWYSWDLECSHTGPYIEGLVLSIMVLQSGVNY